MLNNDNIRMLTLKILLIFVYLGIWSNVINDTAWAQCKNSGTAQGCQG